MDKDGEEAEHHMTTQRRVITSRGISQELVAQQCFCNTKKYLGILLGLGLYGAHGYNQTACDQLFL